MKFGVRADQDTGASSGGDWIQYIRKNGEMTFRFLEDWPVWTIYWEHFSQDKMLGYPCTGDRATCPGCTSPNEREARPTKRLLVNAVPITGDRAGRASLWKFAGGLKEALERFRAKSPHNTLTDRPYTIIRSEGSTGRVQYDIDREDVEPFDASKFELKNHQEALSRAWAEANDPEKTAQVMADREARKNASQQVEEAKDDGDPLDVFRTEAQKERAQELKEQEPKSERRLSVVENDQEEERSLTPSAIRRMSLDDLKELYRFSGLDAPESTDRREVAEALITHLKQESKASV